MGATTYGRMRVVICSDHQRIGCRFPTCRGFGLTRIALGQNRNSGHKGDQFCLSMRVGLGQHSLKLASHRPDRNPCRFCYLVYALAAPDLDGNSRFCGSEIENVLKGFMRRLGSGFEIDQDYDRVRAGNSPVFDLNSPYYQRSGALPWNRYPGVLIPPAASLSRTKQRF